MIEITQALAWPVTAIVIAIAFYRPLNKLFEALGARTTKLSLFKVEIELAAAAPPRGTPVLEQIKDLRIAPLADSSHQLFLQVQDTRPADYAIIDIGDGEEWLTSRLFIAATMLHRMRGAECLVFAHREGAQPGRVLAVTSAVRLRWSLAQRYPWLEVEFARAYADVMVRNYAAAPPVMPSGGVSIISDTGAVDSERAAALVGRFISLLQQNAPPITDASWTDLRDGRYEHATWVTHDVLRDVLLPDDFRMWVNDADPDGSRVELTRAILRKRAPFVALVDSRGQFSRLINRGALLEETVMRMRE